MDSSTPGFPVLHYLPALWICAHVLWTWAQTHVHWTDDDIQPPHPLPPPPSPALSLSQHQGFFPICQLFTSGDQSNGASASTSVPPMRIKGWVPLGLTGLISLLSKGLSRVFFSIKIWKHRFFGAQPSLWSNVGDLGLIPWLGSFP